MRDARAPHASAQLIPFPVHSSPAASQPDAEVWVRLRLTSQAVDQSRPCLGQVLRVGMGVGMARARRSRRGCDALTPHQRGGERRAAEANPRAVDLSRGPMYVWSSRYADSSSLTFLGAPCHQLDIMCGGLSLACIGYEGGSGRWAPMTLAVTLAARPRNRHAHSPK